MPRFEPIGTLREANDRGYDCLLVSDATESYFPHFKQATLEMVRQMKHCKLSFVSKNDAFG